MEKRHFTGFYNSYVERIYKFVYFRVSGRKELAQDLTQEIFLKAFEAFERYDPAISETSWLYTIARNHIINYHAKQHPGVTLEEIEDSSWVSVDTREAMATKQEMQSVWEALKRIPKEDADLVRMKYLEGWSFEDLVKHFEKSSGALRVQAGRALKKLKSKLMQKYTLV
ncbi:MAG: sigma-70 family RNA polymerase sigma factor [Candidatus Uhrbacteria bacterium]|nr:sigma-70 family RNA polymerase sigma factor [Candidatus Uhrbacteria bacterium]